MNSDGTTQVQLGASGLRLTGSVVESKVTALDGVAVFAMTKVRERVLFSGQDDANLKYDTGSIVNGTATLNEAGAKISSIQAL